MRLSTKYEYVLIKNNVHNYENATNKYNQ